LPKLTNYFIQGVQKKITFIKIKKSADIAQLNMVLWNL